MPSHPLPVTAPLTAPAHLRRLRVELADGARTTVHVARYPLATTDVRVVRLRRPQPLAAWCTRNDAPEALVGGFYVRPFGTPLGELRTRGVERRHIPFDAPWGAVRACVHVAGGEVRIARRDMIVAQPRGDLLQAGPLLVADGQRCAVTTRASPPAHGSSTRTSPRAATRGPPWASRPITCSRWPATGVLTTRWG